MKSERLKHKCTMQEFRQKLETYIMTNMTKGSDVVCLVRKLENPMTELEKKEPSDLSARSRDINVH